MKTREVVQDCTFVTAAGPTMLRKVKAQMTTMVAMAAIIGSFRKGKK
jgi:hypothetical protein